MVETHSIVLQSPNFDGTGGNGEQIPLPVVQGINGGQGLADVLTLFAGENVSFDLGKLKEAITVQGVFTDSNAPNIRWKYDTGSSSWTNYKDAIHMRDVLLRTRKVWPSETASGGWDSGGLPTEEQDSGTNRAKGRVRLIFDKTYLSDVSAGTIDTSSLKYMFFYGFVTSYQEGPRLGASHRSRIPFNMSFLPSSVVITV